MLDHKKYIDIKAFQTKFADWFEVGDDIQISEKVDGANFSLEYNPQTDSLDCFSRKQPLSPTMTLNGAYEYVQKLNKEPFKKYVGYRLFGEWLIKNKITYPQDVMRKMYCFDVWDTKNECWMPQEFSIKMAKDVGLPYVPVFYEDKFISWEHISSFVGKSNLGVEEGEGICVINKTRLKNHTYSDRFPFITKLVTANFKERMNKAPKEPIDPDELARREYMRDLTATVVTNPRIDKTLFKMIVEDQLIPEDWSAEDMPVIARNLPSLVYKDCVKEANDVVVQVDGFGKICSSLVMNRVKELLAKKQRV